MGRYAFIQENSHRQKIKALLISGSTLLIFVAVTLVLFYQWGSITQNFPIADKITEHVRRNIVNFTPAGLFYDFFLGGIFFVPSPDEVLFYYAMGKIGFFYPFIFSLAGFMLAQILNYYLGLKLSPFILHFVSKSKVYATRRFVNKYGAYGIFISNFLPLPGPLLTFALGIAKYNFSRAFMISLAGKACKFIAIAIIYHVASGYYL